ncbi:MAG: hypothetical protein Q8P05_02300 [Candidatus Diapherotrites archaeon]|nr:hypothetical protein [Candidatus Diapherotrites archaeon]MDZ4256979.1 hypothetical protein [archaeon]
MPKPKTKAVAGRSKKSIPVSRRKPLNLIPILMGVFILFLLLIVGAVLVLMPIQRTVTPIISDYDSCVAAGYPSTDGIPSTCATPDGRTFVQNLPGIQSFEECALYYPVMESFPEQCRTPDGRLFVKSYPTP